MNLYLSLTVILCLLAERAKCLNSCSLSDEQLKAQDPNLKVMKYDIGDGENTFLAYVPPDVASFYQSDMPGAQVVRPRH